MSAARRRTVLDADGWVSMIPKSSRVMRPQSTLETFDAICAKVRPGEKWVDANPPSWSKAHVTKRLPLKWMAPREYFGDGVEIALYKPTAAAAGSTGSTGPAETVAFSDPKQGDVGNCWFISALAIVAKASPATIRKTLTRSNEAKGVYEFTFYDETLRSAVRVCVDERLPVHATERCIVYCFSETVGELWPSLIEKAFAKAYGSYTITEMGSNAIGVYNLTGKPYTAYLAYYNPERMRSANALWAKLASVDKARNAIGVSFVPQPREPSYAALDVDPASEHWVVRDHKPHNIVSGHAYSVLSVHEVVEAGVRTRLVRIRNPWGRRGEWLGDWSDKSSKWTARLKRLVPFSELGDEDGVFFMSIEDLARNVECIGVCAY
jgi:calpain-15